MKIRIAKEDLVKALKKVIGGIGVGGKDLDYLKITADSTGVEFMTTGRLLGIKTKVSERLEVKEPGECCTNCRRALEIASLMPEGEITIRQKDSALFMEAERCHLKGEVGDLEKVLPFQALEGEEKRLSLNAYTFKQMITDVLFACYRGKENPQMSSVYFEIADSTVQVTALDGHQIAIRKEEVKPTGIHANCMIRGAILSAILPLIPSDIEKEVTFVIGENRFLLETETDKTESLQRFIQKVKQITELKALTPELIHEFVDRIVVYAPRYLDGKRVQLLDIYYSGVGILHELIPEEMEEAFQQHLAERNKEKTA